MPVAEHSLPLTQTLAPTSEAELARAVADAHAARTPVYPIGGGTALDFGLPPKQAGVGLSLAGLNRVVDYPARDMTITVEAGITLAELAAQLAGERQRLPVDAATPEQATIGGLVATAFSGPRRYGHGLLRDYVIGIRAVDGRGTAFKAGGRVVKNVAGYDFCKMLTGSLGTLAVVTEVTLKLRPLPESLAMICCPVSLDQSAERMIAALTTSRATPVAVELAAGEAWHGDPVFGALVAASGAALCVAVEGTPAEIDWLVNQLAGEWRTLGVMRTNGVQGDEANACLGRLRDFGAVDYGALTVKLAVRPSDATAIATLLRSTAADVSLAARAGSGVIIGRCPRMTAVDAASLLLKHWHPAARMHQGHLAVWGGSAAGELTRQAYWGSPRADHSLLSAVKQQFDPAGILNPGRFMI